MDIRRVSRPGSPTVLPRLPRHGENNATSIGKRPLFSTKTKGPVTSWLLQKIRERLELKNFCHKSKEDEDILQVHFIYKISSGFLKLWNGERIRCHYLGRCCLWRHKERRDDGHGFRERDNCIRLVVSIVRLDF